VNKEVFYRNLVAGLIHAGFNLQAGDSSQDGLSKEHDQVLSNIRSAAELVVQVQPRFDRDFIQQHLDMVRAWAAIACVKYSFAQPVMIAVVEADRLTEEEFIKLAKRFDQIIVQMLAVTAKMDVGGPGKARLGSFGVLLFVFFDPQAASRFVEHTQRKCKVWHIWKKTYVLPWLVDVANKTVSGHRGLPFLMSAVLKRDNLQKEIFQYVV
jgi:hypothetical protein